MTAFDEIYPYILLGLCGITLLLVIIKMIIDGVSGSGKMIKEEFRNARIENNELFRSNRDELGKALKSFEDRFRVNTKELNQVLATRFMEFTAKQSEINKLNTENLKEIRQSVERHLKAIQEENSRKLEEVKVIVDEKLQKTLNARLSQSFETVGKQLKAVQEGLGEMKTIATDVGGLKKVLSNVKLRGGIGEVQLEMLLEQILAPDQYEKNVQTKKGSSDSVEFAIKLPGRDKENSTVWLPIDAKFPKDVYEHVLSAYESGDADRIAETHKLLDRTVKGMAKDIHSKYIDPPHTTDFGIMFLPFEGIFAEVIRRTKLLEDLQRDFKIIVVGPTTLAAILNSLQMGFKTLAIEKRSSEVWNVLASVKKEFENFGGLMEKAQKNIQTGLSQLDDVMGKRTRAIQRKLRDVESLSSGEPALGLDDFIDDEEYSPLSQGERE